MLARKDTVDDLWPSDDERARLEAILGPYYQATLEAMNRIVGRTLRRRITPVTMVVTDAAVTRILGEAATQVQRIDETTRTALRGQLQLGAQRGYSTWQIAHGMPADGYRGIDGLFQETWRGRGDTVARTELQHASVVASRDRFVASGVVDRVEIIDGDDDQPCSSRNGTTVPLEQAPGIAHPNCTLVLVPVLRQNLDEPAVPEARTPEWGEWKTPQEAEQAASARYPNVRFDFADAVLDTIDPTLRQFDTLAKQYPQVAARLEYVGTYAGENAPVLYNGSWTANEYAHATRNGKIIGLNPAWYGDPTKFRESLRLSEELAWHPKGTSGFESVLTHEFGHQVDNWMQSVSSLVAAADVVDMGGNGLVQDTYRRWRNKHKAGRKLSDYAQKNAEEGWAESFAAQYHSPATVRAQAYVKNQRELLKALNPENWRAEAGTRELLAQQERNLAAERPGSPAHDALKVTVERLREQVRLAPAGEWRWLRDFPQDERPAAFRRLDQWQERFGL